VNAPGPGEDGTQHTGRRRKGLVGRLGIVLEVCLPYRDGGDMVSTAGGGQKETDAQRLRCFSRTLSLCQITVNTLLNLGEPSLYILEEGPRPCHVQSDYDCGVRGRGLGAQEV
jgi:hypothetical protein